MSEKTSWENECCRCGSDVQVNLSPGKRACHLTCGPCTYPENWSKCNSCEIVGHCTYALNDLKRMEPDGVFVKKGCYFSDQLTGEESLYHTLQFVNSQQNRVSKSGEQLHLKILKGTNSKSPCLKEK